MERKPLNVETCPTSRELEAYAGKQLIGTRNEEIFLHLKHCATCLRTLAQLTQVPSPEGIIRGGGSVSWWQHLLTWCRRVLRR